MPRRGRDEGEGALHHVVPKGNGGRRIVLDEHDRRAYLARFNRIVREREWVVHASCLLDTHHHAVVQTRMPDLGDGMRIILGGHAAWLNARHGTSGSVFAERFWSARIWDGRRLLRASLYTFLNPVAAGLVEHPRDWRWSSFAELERGGCTSLLAATVEGGTQAFVALVEDAVVRLHQSRLSGRDALLEAVRVPDDAAQSPKGHG